MQQEISAQRQLTLKAESEYEEIQAKIIKQMCRYFALAAFCTLLNSTVVKIDVPCKYTSLVFVLFDFFNRKLSCVVHGNWWPRHAGGLQMWQRKCV